FLRTPNDARLVVPNEKLAGSVLRNDSIVTDTVSVEVEVWLPHEIDELRALRAIADGVEGARPGIAEVNADGVVVSVGAPPVSVRERAGREAELRAKCLQALREAGLRGA
ncbi:MAG TPA: hypothetical protein VHF89_15515, partial [Solirubrobacteraceae bacterium]|nr:hypothetical protein [Solirubrobacteraceae bacterium]